MKVLTRQAAGKSQGEDFQSQSRLRGGTGEGLNKRTVAVDGEDNINRVLHTPDTGREVAFVHYVRGDGEGKLKGKKNMRRWWPWMYADGMTAPSPLAEPRLVSAKIP